MPSHRGNDHVCLSDAPHSIPLDGEVEKNGEGDSVAIEPLT